MLLLLFEDLSCMLKLKVPKQVMAIFHLSLDIFYTAPLTWHFWMQIVSHVCWKYSYYSRNKVSADMTFVCCYNKKHSIISYFQKIILELCIRQGAKNIQNELKMWNMFREIKITKETINTKWKEARTIEDRDIGDWRGFGKVEQIISWEVNWLWSHVMNQHVLPNISTNVYAN